MAAFARRGRFGRRGDQIRSSMDPQATEAAEIAKAVSGIAPARDRIVGQVALVIGTAPGAFMVDAPQRIVRATAAELPGLPPAGYRRIEARARSAAPGWRVEVVPPATGARRRRSRSWRGSPMRGRSTM